MKTTTLVLVATVSMAGCATVPKTSTQLVETSGTTQSYCYSMPRVIVGERIELLLSQCYGEVETIIPIGAAYVPISADFQVINEELPNGNRYSVRNFVGFGYSADVISDAIGISADCETEVRMYAVSGFWRNTFDAVDRAVRNEDSSCP
jgi:hypothetical protein